MSPLTESTRLTLAKSFTWNESVWNPSMVQTEWWYDASDATTVFTDAGVTPATNGQTVRQWNNKNGLLGRNLSQATAGNRPTYSTGLLNSLAGIDWGSALNNKSLFNSFDSSPVRLFGVADYDGLDPFPVETGLVTFAGGSTSPTTDLLYGDINTTVWYNNYPVHLNGNAASGTALPAISSPFVFATNAGPTSQKPQIYIGIDRNFSNRGWRGKIYEIFSTPTTPSTDTRQKLEGYLAHKWGLTANLPAGHPYKTVGPTP